MLDEVIKGTGDFVWEHKTPIAICVGGALAIGVGYWLLTKHSIVADAVHLGTKMSQDSTQQNVFTDPHTGEPDTIQVTGAPGSTSLIQPYQAGETYSEFMDQQNPIVAVGAAIANTALADLPAGYGAWAADQTTSSVARAYGISEQTVAQNYANLDGAQQVLVALGQAITAPLGGGGAAGWGASLGSWLGW